MKRISTKGIIYILLLLTACAFFADSIYKKQLAEENEVKQQQRTRLLKKLERDIALEELSLEVEAINKRNTDAAKMQQETSK